MSGCVVCGAGMRCVLLDYLHYCWPVYVSWIFYGTIYCLGIVFHRNASLLIVILVSFCGVSRQDSVGCDRLPLALLTPALLSRHIIDAGHWDTLILYAWTSALHGGRRSVTADKRELPSQPFTSVTGNDQDQLPFRFLIPVMICLAILHTCLTCNYLPQPSPWAPWTLHYSLAQWGITLVSSILKRLFFITFYSGMTITCPSHSFISPL